ncbi:MAG TPA: hypothetical protein VI815_03020 [Candidatus Nanoarchaeia archaeon]|nr:hypothetical protein [Candidatus Nanoarchaeia archaeon]
MKQLLEAIKAQLVSILVIILLGFAIYFGWNQIQELKKENERLVTIQTNNMKALGDSLRMLIDAQGHRLYQQMGFYQDIQRRQNETLEDQGFELRSIQDLTLSLIKIVVRIDSGKTQYTDSTIVRTFKKDTLWVSIDGKTVINTKNDTRSFTELSILSKPIPIEVAVSQNEKGEIVGSVKCLIPGVELRSLKTSVDPGLYAGQKANPTFFELLKIGGLVGISDQYGININKLQAVYGLEIMYDSYGVWYVKTGQNNTYGIKVSKSIKDIFKF